MRRLALSLILALAGSGCATTQHPETAQQASPTPPQPSRTITLPATGMSSDPAAVELIDAFGQFCLQQFPERNDPAPTSGGTLAPMPPDTVRRFLHDDPGRGWVYRAQAEYVLTIEDPPYHACAVRRRYPKLPDYQGLFDIARQIWAVNSRRGPFQALPPQAQTAFGLPVQARMAVLPRTATTPQEVFMDLTTTYSNGTVEVRLVRQIPPQ